MDSGTISVLLACAYPFFASAFTDEAFSARAYLEGGRRLQSQGHLVDAERQFNLAISQAEREPNGSDLVVDALSNSASVQTDMAHLDEAATSYSRAIAVLSRTAAGSDPRLAELVIKMAELYLEANQPKAATKLLTNMMAREHKPIQRNGISTLILDVMACVYAQEHKFALAVSFERESLGILEGLSTRQVFEWYVVEALVRSKCIIYSPFAGPLCQEFRPRDLAAYGDSACRRQNRPARGELNLDFLMNGGQPTVKLEKLAFGAITQPRWIGSEPR